MVFLILIPRQSGSGPETHHLREAIVLAAEEEMQGEATEAEEALPAT